MPIFDQSTFELFSGSEQQTKGLGVRLGQLLDAGDVICLSGDVGAGKSVVARGIGKGWGTLEPLTSAMHAIIKEYSRPQDRQTLYHVDCYRLSGIDEASLVGIEELFDQAGVVMIEWAEKVVPLLPDDRLWIELKHVEAGRRALQVTASGPRSIQLLERFREAVIGRKIS